MKWYRPERPEKPESFSYSTIMEPRRRSWFNWSRSIYAWNQRWSTKVGDIEVGCIPVSWSTESDSRVKLTNPRHVERNLQSYKQHQTTKKDPMMVAISSPKKSGSDLSSTFRPSHVQRSPGSAGCKSCQIGQHHQYIHHQQWLKMLDADFIWFYTSGCLPQRALASPVPSICSCTMGGSPFGSFCTSQRGVSPLKPRASGQAPAVLEDVAGQDALVLWVPETMLSWHNPTWGGHVPASHVWWHQRLV
jgi:hypothetical protein